MTLLVNPAAGGGRAGRHLDQVAAAARQWWPAHSVRLTSGPGEAAALARDASAAGSQVILVVGGDGTVHEAANGILDLDPGARPMLAVIPIGTGNDFARLTGTSRLPVAEAVRRLASGVRRDFDVGRVWGEYFVNSLGLGFDAAVAARVPRYRRLVGRLVYLAAVASAWREYRPVRLAVTLDGAQLQEPLFCVEVGIGVSAGGGFYLTPDARPDDGLFDVCLVRPVGTWGFFTRFPTAFWGGHTRLKEVRMRRCRTLIVSGPAPLDAHLDGELRSGRDGTMTIELIPAALPVLTAGPA